MLLLSSLSFLLNEDRTDNHTDGLDNDTNIATAEVISSPLIPFVPRLFRSSSASPSALQGAITQRAAALDVINYTLVSFLSGIHRVG